MFTQGKNGLGKPVFLLRRAGVMVSYNPDVADMALDALGDVFLGEEAPSEKDETALMRAEGGDPCLVLVGDHREAYEAVIADGWAACRAYYESQVVLGRRSRWSSDLDPAEPEEGSANA